jgi:hypothetical protein
VWVPEDLREELGGTYVIPLDITARIAAVTNEDELSQALLQAFSCGSILEFGGSLP